MRRVGRVLLGGAALLALGACSPTPQTEIVVVVSTNLARGTRLRSVRVTAQRSGAATSLHDRSYSLEGLQFPLPGEVVLVARDADDTRPLTVRVVGDLGGPMLQQEAVVRFQRERTLYLQMSLAGECVGVPCAMGQTCRLGVCEAPERAVLTEAPPTNTLHADASADVPGDVTDAATASDRVEADAADVVDAAMPADAVDVPLADDVTDVPVAMDAVDVPAAMDVVDVPAAEDVTDVPMAMDVVDVPMAMDVPAAMDVVDVVTPMDAVDVVTPTDVPMRVDGSCLSNEARCGTVCVDLRSDRSNCGACGTVCQATTPGAVGACNDGACGEACPSGTVLQGPECVLDRSMPRFPASLSRHPQRQTVFAWRGSPGIGRAYLEICRTRDCATPEYAGEVSADARPGVELDPGVHFWRVTGIRGDNSRQPPSLWWSFHLTSRRTTAVRPWGNYTDFNGDGLVDLLLQTSASEFSVRLGTDRAPWLRDGGALRVPSVALPTATTPSASRARYVGDLNGDGRGDIAVLASYGTSTRRDVVYVFWGAETGVSATPQTVLTTASTAVPSSAILDVTGAGDADFDGFSDLAISYRDAATARVRIRVWAGRWFGVSAMPSRELVTAGTFTGSIRGWAFRTDDPFPDLLAQEESPSAWAMFHAGSVANGYTRFDGATIPGSCDPQWVGTTNTDGRARVFCPSVLTAGAVRHRATMYGGADLAQLPEVARRNVANTTMDDVRVARGVGDVDGDGSDDVVFIARSNGAAAYRGWVSPGGASAFGADAALPSGLCDETVAPLGDVNRDGFDDFYAGCRLFFGRADRQWSVSSPPTVTLGGPPATGSGQCPPGMRLIPGGTFMMGNAAAPQERPVHSVRLSSYCMDTTEVTVTDYARCPGTTCETPSVAGPGMTWAVTGRENHPVNGVYWRQARDFCRWRGGDLPTEAQWEYAARGNDARTYPWGSAGPAAQLCWNLPESRGGCPVATHPLGDSFFGLSDMAGSVGEWALDVYGPYPMDTGTPLLNPISAASGSGGVVRGGAFDVTTTNLVRAAWREPFYDQGIRTHYIGFRCARSTP